MDENDKMYLKVQKNKKLLYLEISNSDTVEHLKATIRTFFSKQELHEIQLFKDDVILNESSTLNEQNVNCGDRIGVKFFRIVRLGNPPEWDNIDSMT